MDVDFDIIKNDFDSLKKTLLSQQGENDLNHLNRIYYITKLFKYTLNLNWTVRNFKGYKLPYKFRTKTTVNIMKLLNLQQFWINNKKFNRN